MSEAKILWRRLEEEEKRIVVQTARVKQAWKNITRQHKQLDEQRARFESSPELEFLDPGTRVKLNVGGHRFETTAKVLCRDRFSVLAALCKKTPPLAPDAEGVFFIERDWWLFRYIIIFLREMTLPDDPDILKELLTEAAFFRIGRLQSAIEGRLKGHTHPAGSFEKMGHTASSDMGVGGRGAAAAASSGVVASATLKSRRRPRSVSPRTRAAAQIPLDIPVPARRRPFGRAAGSAGSPLGRSMGLGSYDPEARYGDTGYDRRRMYDEALPRYSSPMPRSRQAWMSHDEFGQAPMGSPHSHQHHQEHQHQHQHQHHNHYQHQHAAHNPDEEYWHDRSYAEYHPNQDYNQQYGYDDYSYDQMGFGRTGSAPGVAGRGIRQQVTALPDPYGFTGQQYTHQPQHGHYR